MQLNLLEHSNSCSWQQLAPAPPPLASQLHEKGAQARQSGYSAAATTSSCSFPCTAAAAAATLPCLPPSGLARRTPHASAPLQLCRHLAIVGHLPASAAPVGPRLQGDECLCAPLSLSLARSLPLFPPLRCARRRAVDRPRQSRKVAEWRSTSQGQRRTTPQGRRMPQGIPLHTLGKLLKNIWGSPLSELV